jgi:hypothetical protein
MFPAASRNFDFSLSVKHGRSWQLALFQKRHDYLDDGANRNGVAIARCDCLFDLSGRGSTLDPAQLAVDGVMCLGTIEAVGRKSAI